ncbi:hypothetical protein H6F74_27160 [Trichocoleus sp. FACHB-90]|uniref:hypothetical protein n=1 Tax=Cyanophyceae TaxID=3028117 RepID=UPI0019B23E02|nr:hypothetical protein [Trichocoleus sp. FACHB-90]MBD1929883.1 hypothetical protein [Trichocoleus sp. FACHB-90]
MRIFKCYWRLSPARSLIAPLKERIQHSLGNSYTSGRTIHQDNRWMRSPQS